MNDYDLLALTPTNPSEATETSVTFPFMDSVAAFLFFKLQMGMEIKVFGPSPFSNIKSCQHIIASKFYEVLFTNPKPYDLSNELMLISFSQSRRTLGVAVRILRYHLRDSFAIFFFFQIRPDISRRSELP